MSNNLDILQELCDEIAVIRSGCSVMQVQKQEFDREKLICLMTGKDPVPLSTEEQIHRVPVSYTHLDVYKRQIFKWCLLSAAAGKSKGQFPLPIN